VITSFSVSSGYEKTKELLEKCENLDGIICATDTMAAGTMQYLREHKIGVPDKILVAGHGDSEMSRVTNPPILTVHYSYQKSGELAISMLMEALEEEVAVVKEVKLGCYVVEY
jgi:LacI family sucrose operon transcriptional repressor